MNATSTSATSERALLAKLREMLADLAWPNEILEGQPAREKAGVDAVVRLKPSEGRPVQLFVKCKADMRPSSFPAWAREWSEATAKRRAVLVLAMPFVSERMAELCRDAGCSWFDLAGNCRIDVPGRLHIERSGNQPAHRVPRPAANLGTAAAARVLRVLLSPAHAGHSWTQRDLLAATCWKADADAPVSLGLVNKVVRHLKDEGFIEVAADRGVRVSDAARLLAAWSAAYSFDRHERRSFFTLLKDAKLAEALYQVGLDAGGLAAYAAFSAAERQAPHVRQAKTWLYVDARFLDAFVRRAEAKEVDSGENLVVLVPEDAGVFLSFDPDAAVGDRVLGCTDPVQTYVDLAHCGGRGEEAAAALLEQRIVPAWKAVGGA